MSETDHHTSSTEPVRFDLTSDDFPPLEDGPFDPRVWFSSERCGNPLHIEIGSGKGTFLVQEASLPHNQNTNFLGIEYAGEYCRYAVDRVARHHLTNVRVLYADAADFIRYRVCDGVCSVIHLYFPDPWPKRRHHKRRMVQMNMLEEFHRVLVPGGEMRVVTDHDDYWKWMREHFEQSKSLFRLEPFVGADSAGEGEVVGTNFERKYRREGRPFHSVILRRL